MTSPRTDAAAGTDVDASRALVTAATQRLLGDTITVLDADWRAPSKLPGWSRGHVATHLARQADALSRLVRGALSGRPEPMYASPEHRDAEIESGAQRSGLELQVDLDTAAEALTESFDRVAQQGGWEATTELRGGDQVPLSMLPTARLSEVVLHHVDLDVGFSVGDIDQQTAERLLQWCAFRLRKRADFPELLLLSDSGFQQPAGSAGDAVTVQGTSADLLGWVTGRTGSEALTGADRVELPPFG